MVLFSVVLNLFPVSFDKVKVFAGKGDKFIRFDIKNKFSIKTEGFLDVSLARVEIFLSINKRKYCNKQKDLLHIG